MVVPEFDPPYDIYDLDICQLIPGTEDGFSMNEAYTHSEIGSDSPFVESHCDPPHWDNYCDPPHWQD